MIRNLPSTVALLALTTAPCFPVHAQTTPAAPAVPTAAKVLGTRAQLQIALMRDGKPLGRKVRAHLLGEAGASTPHGVFSDANGVFNFMKLPAGHYTLWLVGEQPSAVEQKGKAATSDVPSSVFNDLDVTGGADTERLELTVPLAGTVEGKLLLPDGKTPARGYVIAVQSAVVPDGKMDNESLAAAYASGARECYAQATVQPDGSFVLHGLTKGAHAMDVRRPGERTAWSTIPVVPVFPGTTMSIGTWNVPKVGWQHMFDGKTLKGWKQTDFAGHATARAEHGQIVLPIGDDMTGVTWTGDLPRVDYEISLEARRVEGNDFFCGLTFPVQADPCTLVLGGWGGQVVGLSSINSSDASENETTKAIVFDQNRWYRVRLRVTKPKIEAWLDNEKIVDLDLADKKLSIRIEVEESKPLGIATWRTTGATRDIRLRRLADDNAP